MLPTLADGPDLGGLHKHDRDIVTNSTMTCHVPNAAFPLVSCPVLTVVSEESPGELKRVVAQKKFCRYRRSEVMRGLV